MDKLIPDSSNGLDIALDSKKIPCLDGIRVVAVSLVMLYHSFGWIGGRLGVSAFFVLSGFLITWLLLKETAAKSRVSLSGFYRRRSLRIFPAYFFFLFVVFTIEYIQSDETIRKFIMPSIFYYYNYYYPIVGEKHEQLSHIWSLCVEEQFYLLWPILFIVCFRYGQNVQTLFLAVVLVAGLIWRYVAYFHLGFEDKWLYRTFDARFDNLAIGCLLAVLLFNINSRRYISGFVYKGWLFPILIGALLLSRFVGKAYPGYSYTLGFSVEAIIISVMLVLALARHREKPFLWLSSKYAVSIGAISYPMYLYHEIGAGISDKASGVLEQNFSISLPYVLVAIAGFGVTLLLAGCSYRIIERPFLALK
ncbi:acyltransferase [Moritella sp. 5]|uniref:acyltransferase family protein n=1 Tax=Moritella sp. 5 TaxID=2746231 RepID=UPI001BA69E6F|nr:acyltransferase [Moritella sp. 5]QUM80569.1 acyltransferase [Moritella sp. 5]